MEGPVGLAPTPPRFTVSGCCLTLRSHCRGRNRTFTCQFQRLVDILLSHPAKMEPQLGSAPRRLLYERSGFLIIIAYCGKVGTAGRLRSGVGCLEDRGPTIER